MTDDDSEEPAVTLGAGQAVEGAPLARVSARLMWGIEKSAVREREGETLIRTPDGPTELETLLTDVDKQYFSTRQEFEAALSDVIGDGAVPVESDGEDDSTEDAEEEPADADSNDGSADAEEEPTDDEESDDEPADAEDGSDETVEAEDADGESAEADDATADEEVAFDSDSE